jgi:hypothetical protein
VNILTVVLYLGDADANANKEVKRFKISEKGKMKQGPRRQTKSSIFKWCVIPDFQRITCHNT